MLNHQYPNFNSNTFHFQCSLRSFKQSEKGLIENLVLTKIVTEMQTVHGNFNAKIDQSVINSEL